jgi:hypothetical protein
VPYFAFAAVRREGGGQIVATLEADLITQINSMSSKQMHDSDNLKEA